MASKICLLLPMETSDIPQMAFPVFAGGIVGWDGQGWATGYLSPPVRRISCCPRNLRKAVPFRAPERSRALVLALAVEPIILFVR